SRGHAPPLLQGRRGRPPPEASGHFPTHWRVRRGFAPTCNLNATTPAQGRAGVAHMLGAFASSTIGFKGRWVQLQGVHSLQRRSAGAGKFTAAAAARLAGVSALPTMLTSPLSTWKGANAMDASGSTTGGVNSCYSLSRDRTPDRDHPVARAWQW